MTAQLTLPLAPPCAHRTSFISCAYVPAGDVCCHCGLLLSQFIPQPPEVLGYVSGTWQWKLDGKPWTTATAEISRAAAPVCY